MRGRNAAYKVRQRICWATEGGKVQTRGELSSSGRVGTEAKDSEDGEGEDGCSGGLGTETWPTKKNESGFRSSKTLLVLDGE